jgi:hypothetical protein
MRHFDEGMLVTLVEIVTEIAEQFQLEVLPDAFWEIMKRLLEFPLEFVFLPLVNSAGRLQTSLLAPPSSTFFSSIVVFLDSRGWASNSLILSSRLSILRPLLDNEREAERTLAPSRSVDRPPSRIKKFSHLGVEH